MTERVSEFNTPSAVPARSRIRALQANLIAYGFMTPAIILAVLFFIIPAILVVYLSLTDLSTANFTSDISQMNFIGLQNYATLLNDAFAKKILFNTVFYVVVTLSLFNIGAALLVALLTVHVNRRAGFFYRALWLLPRITSGSVYVLMWRRIIAEPPYGILNQVNILLGQPTVVYAAEDPWTFVILVNGFIGLSFGMIIF
ncbi:MAG: sugar ABC transporter permease, partial [Anaerolineae bacterium]|nr:sugar ABC transporter permease [Anaerolineae bacterium]